MRGRGCWGWRRRWSRASSSTRTTRSWSRSARSGVSGIAARIAGGGVPAMTWARGADGGGRSTSARRCACWRRTRRGLSAASTGRGRGGAVGQACRRVHPQLRGHRRVAGGQHLKDRDLRAVADRVADGRADRRAGHRRGEGGPRPVSEPDEARVRRDLDPQGPEVPDRGGRPPFGPAGVGGAGPGSQDGREVPGPAGRRALPADPARVLRRRRLDHPADRRALPERRDLPGRVAHRQGRDRRAR